MAIVELIMPKMGESIIEATIISWLKKEGDQIDADEMVLEIATDKVDSEVPSPVSGVIKKILHHPEDVVGVGKPLALIETEEFIKEESVKTKTEVKQEQATELPRVRGDAEINVEKFDQAKSKKTLPFIRKSIAEQIPSISEGRFYSPLVRNIAKAEGISIDELNQLEGTGADGRVTKYDLLNYVDLLKVKKSSSIKGSATSAPSVPTPTTQFDFRKSDNPELTHPDVASSKQPSDEVIEVSRMRKVIASHMKHSIDTAAHVTSFVEADASRIVNWRNKVKDEYFKRNGEKLTFSPIFAEVVINALRDFPEINASFDGERLILKKSLNLGIATAMENGNLIVPVINNAGELNLIGLTKKLNDLTARARKNQLNPEEIQGGTFTISNIGTFNNLMGTPIIPQPQLAILALGAIKKKPVILETPEGDIIAIRHMMFLSLSFDHRVIDGFQGGSFLNRIVHYIETFDSNRPL